MPSELLFNNTHELVQFMTYSVSYYNLTYEGILKFMLLSLGGK